MSTSTGNENGQAFINFMKILGGDWYCPMCGSYFIPPHLPCSSHHWWVHPKAIPRQTYAECPVCGRILKCSGKYADPRTRDERNRGAGFTG
jgi:rubredoxin